MRFIYVVHNDAFLATARGELDGPQLLAGFD